MKFLLATLFFIGSFIASNSQQASTINSSEFVQECMKISGTGARRQMVLWLPYNFWQLVNEQIVHQSPAIINEITNSMKDYLVFCVADYTMTPPTIDFRSDEDIRKTIHLVDSAGNIYKPLDENDISSTASLMLASMKPAMAQMMGQFGSGMRMFIFDAKKINGEPDIKVDKKTQFTLSWDEFNVKWKLPLAAVLPPLFCPVDNEPMKGNWNYCPEHGAKLVSKKD